MPQDMVKKMQPWIANFPVILVHPAVRVNQCWCGICSLQHLTRDRRPIYFLRTSASVLF